MRVERVMVLSLEEHVHRLKNTMGRTAKGILTQVASSVEASPWYSKLLEEYIQTCPAALERGPLVMGYIQQLQDMTMETMKITGFDILVEIAKAVPDMQLLLRRGSVDELKSLFRVKLSILGTYLEEKEQVVLQKANLDKINVILTEALALYPVDAKLNDWSCLASDLLQESGQKEVIHSVLSSLHKLKMKESEEVSQKDFEHNISEVLAEISHSTLTLDMLCEEEKAAMEDIFFGIFHDLNKFLDVSKLGGLANNTTTILGKISGWLNKNPLQCAVLALEDGIAASNAYTSLQEVKAEDNAKPSSILSQAVLLHRRVMRWRGAFEQLHGTQVPAALTKLQVHVDKASEALKQTSDQLVEKKTVELKQELNKLVDLACGKQGGLDWVAGFQGESFNQLLLHAQDSLCKLDGDSLVRSIKVMEQVPYDNGSLDVSTCFCGRYVFVNLQLSVSRCGTIIANTSLFIFALN
eukprot:6492445-Amphidinium_carterae.6